MVDLAGVDGDAHARLHPPGGFLVHRSSSKRKENAFREELSSLFYCYLWVCLFLKNC